MRLDRKLVVDVSRATAAFAVNDLPALMELTPSERFERLALLVEGAIVAYAHGCQGWPAEVPEPSQN